MKVKRRERKNLAAAPTSPLMGFATSLGSDVGDNKLHSATAPTSPLMGFETANG